MGKNLNTNEPIMTSEQMEIKSIVECFLIIAGNYDIEKMEGIISEKANIGISRLNEGEWQSTVITITEYFEELKPCSVSKFYLSDVFEYISQCEFEEALVNIARVSRADSRLAFWTLFINRCIPDRFSEKFKLNYDLSRELTFSSRTFFYNNFNVWLIL